MKKQLYLLIIVAIIGSRLMANNDQYVTSYVGTDFALIFPAPDIPKNSKVFRDLRWAIDVVDVKCDGKIIDGAQVEPVSMQWMPEDNIGDVTLIYSCPLSDFVVCSELDPVTRHFRLVEYKVPRMSDKVVVRYRVRLPGIGVLQKIYTVTAYGRPNFPSGRAEER